MSKKKVGFIPPLNAVFDKIEHFLVSEILALGEMNLQVLWDSGDEFEYNYKNYAVETCGNDAEFKIEVFVCHMSSKTGQKDLGFYCFEI